MKGSKGSVRNFEGVVPASSLYASKTPAGAQIQIFIQEIYLGPKKKDSAANGTSHKNLYMIMS